MAHPDRHMFATLTCMFTAVVVTDGISDFWCAAEAAEYVAWYYGVHVPENAVANAASASMDDSGRLHGAIAPRIQAGGYAVIDETMARVIGG